MEYYMRLAIILLIKLLHLEIIFFMCMIILYTHEGKAAAILLFGSWRRYIICFVTYSAEIENGRSSWLANLRRRWFT